jgi:nucleotide-binding universal stress UspA family protein
LLFHAYDTREIREGVKIESIKSALDHFVDVSVTAHGIDRNRVTIHVLEGDLEYQVKSFCDKENPDLLVMGTDGATGVKKFLSGSNTVRVMDEVNVTMLIVPTGFEFRASKNILLCSDLKEVANDNALDVLKSIAVAYESSVRIAHVEEGGNHLHYEEVLEKNRETHVLEPEVPVTFKRIVSKDMKDGIKHYMDAKGDEDMIAMICRDHSLIESILQEDHTHQMAFDTNIPLLVLR